MLFTVMSLIFDVAPIGPREVDPDDPPPAPLVDVLAACCDPPPPAAAVVPDAVGAGFGGTSGLAAVDDGDLAAAAAAAALLPRPARPFAAVTPEAVAAVGPPATSWPAAAPPATWRRLPR